MRSVKPRPTPVFRIASATSAPVDSAARRRLPAPPVPGNDPSARDHPSADPAPRPGCRPRSWSAVTGRRTTRSGTPGAAARSIATTRFGSMVVPLGGDLAARRSQRPTTLRDVLIVIERVVQAREALRRCRGTRSQDELSARGRGRGRGGVGVEAGRAGSGGLLPSPAERGEGCREALPPARAALPRVRSRGKCPAS